MRKLMKNKTSGITLIALVVTVIVLLILAGISIVTLSGDHGILKQAGNAKKSTDQVQLEEDVQTAYLRYEQQMKGKNDLEHYLNQIDNVNIEKLAVDTWYVSRGTAEVTIDIEGEKTTGKSVIWDGSKTPKTPELKKDGNIWHWYIYTPDQLKFLAYFVNNGNKLEPDEGETDTENTFNLTQIVIDDGYNPEDVKIVESTTIVYLMNDLDLGARAENNNWETESNEAKKWTPIGITGNLDKQFKAIFEGNNNAIKGMYVNKSGYNAGLFGRANNTIIKNLTIEKSFFKSESGDVGAIVGYLSTSGEINNCNVKNCQIDSNGNLTGGISGTCGCNITSCNIENSTVKGMSATGGILGSSIDTGMKIENCHNKNTTVILKEGDCSIVGGIIGQAYKGMDGIYNCTNSGKIVAYGTHFYKDFYQQSCGGIVGALNSNGTVSGCLNEGIVIGYNQGERIGGIVGDAKSNSITTKCHNLGNVTGNGNYVGGIAGMAASTIEKCINSGKITQKVGESLGGIVGKTLNNGATKILNCYNIGKITEESSNTNGVGGIIGAITTDNTDREFKYNYNIGEIQIKGTNVTNVGGIIGDCDTQLSYISNNYYELNKSNVTLNNIGEGMSAENMKKQSFVDLLNAEQSPLVWELGTSNNGYPTLKE